MWGYWYFSQQSWFQSMIHPVCHFPWCTLHICQTGWQYAALAYSFPNFEPVSSSTFGLNCYFLTCIQVSQETSKVVWYSCLFKNFPQFVVVYSITGFGVVSEAEVDVFLKLPCFFCDTTNVDNLISSSSSSSKPRLYTWKFSVHVLLRQK